MKSAAFGQAVEAAADGLMARIERSPPSLIGLAVGLGLAWLVSVVASTDIGDDYLSPVELESMLYFGPQPLPVPGRPAAAVQAHHASDVASR